MDYHSYQPHAGHRLPHDPFKAIIAPRPIGWISTIDPQGVANLAPYSFFNAFSDDPPIIGFSSSTRKDTQRNCEATGEFVFNLATLDLSTQMVKSSTSLPPHVSEFEFTSLEMSPSTFVKPPRIKNIAVAMECKVTQIIPVLQTNESSTKNTLILGEVIGVHIHNRFLIDGQFDTAAAQVLARCGYLDEYAVVLSILKIGRPN